MQVARYCLLAYNVVSMIDDDRIQSIELFAVDLKTVGYVILK
jgi:hypothetical protein